MDAGTLEAYNQKLRELQSARPLCKDGADDEDKGYCAGPEEAALQKALVEAQWLLTTLASQISLTHQKMRQATFELVKKVIPSAKDAMDVEAKKLLAALKAVDEEMERELTQPGKTLRKEQVELDDVSDLLNDLAFQRTLQIQWREKTEQAVEAYVEDLRRRNGNFREVSESGFALGQEMRANLLLWSSYYEESARKIREINQEYQSYIAGMTVAAKPPPSKGPSETDLRDRTPWDVLVENAVSQEKSKKGGLRDQQLIIGSLLGPHGGTRSEKYDVDAPRALLIYHDVGTGKTCTAYAVIRAYYDEAVKTRKTFKIVIGLPNLALRGKWLEDIDPSQDGTGCKYGAVGKITKKPGPDEGYLQVNLLPATGGGAVELYFMQYNKDTSGVTTQRRGTWGPKVEEADVVIVDEAHNVVDRRNIPKGMGGVGTDFGLYAFQWGKKWVLGDDVKNRRYKLILLTGTPGSPLTATKEEAEAADAATKSSDDAKELNDLYLLLKAVKRTGPELKPLSEYFELREENGKKHHVWKDLPGFVAATKGLVSYFSYLNVPRIYPHLTAHCGNSGMASYPASDEQNLGEACDYEFEPQRDEVEPLQTPVEPITESEIAARKEKEYGRWRPSYVYVPLESAAKAGAKRGFRANAKPAAGSQASLTGDPTQPKFQRFVSNQGVEQLNNKAKALAAMIHWLNRRDGDKAGKHFVFTLGSTWAYGPSALIYALTKTGSPSERYEFLSPKEVVQQIRKIKQRKLAELNKPLTADLDESESTAIVRDFVRDWFADAQKNAPKKRLVYLGRMTSGEHMFETKGNEFGLLKSTLNALFNDDRNWDGRYIGIFVGSSKDAKEGLDLYDVTYEHFIDPPPNRNWYQQVQGRALRYMAHRRRNKQLFNVPDDEVLGAYGGGPVEVFVYRWVRPSADGEREVMLDVGSSEASRYELAVQVLRSNAIDCPFNRKVTLVKCFAGQDETDEVLSAAEPSDGFLRVNLDGVLDPKGPIRVLTPDFNTREFRISIHLTAMTRQSAETGDYSVGRIFDRFAWQKDEKLPLGGFWYYDTSLRRNEPPSALRERVMNLLRLPEAKNPLTQEQASNYVLTHILAKGHPDWLAVMTKSDMDALRRVVNKRFELRTQKDGAPFTPAEEQAVQRRLRIDAMATFAQRAIPMLSQISLRQVPSFFGPSPNFEPSNPPSQIPTNDEEQEQGYFPNFQ